MHRIGCSGVVTFSLCLSHGPSCANIRLPCGLAAMPAGKHAVLAGESIPVPEWSCLQADESIPVQKCHSMQRWQVHYTGAAVGHQMTMDGL